MGVKTGYEDMRDNPPPKGDTGEGEVLNAKKRSNHVLEKILLL